MTEKELQEAIIELATWRGWSHYHTFDSRRSVAGFPDLVLWKDSRLLFVELKKQGGRLSMSQERTLQELHSTAAEVYIWRPAEWDSGVVEEILG